MRNIISRNPYTGEIKEQIAFLSEQALGRCLDRSASAFKLHSSRSSKDKMAMIKELIPQIERKKDEISRLITFETGRPVIQAENEVKQALRICDYYSKHAENILAINTKSTARKKTLIKFMPTGTVLCITPFTNAFALTLLNTLPQILLGNCVLTKSTATTPGIGKLVEKLMGNAGFESGEYQNCVASRDQCSTIIQHNIVTGLNFTGSTQNGRVVAQIAGKAIKNSTLQLSSNDSMIVMDDANLDLAIESAMKVGHFNCGQGGASPKKIIVLERHYEQFKERIISKAKKVKYGNPLDKQTQIGPLSRPDLYDKLESQLKSLPSSFKVIFQRENIEKPFFPITIIQSEGDVFDEEIMGPIFILYKAKGNAEAIEFANKSRYGNNHYIFSSKKGEEIADQLQSGAIYFNQISNINSYFPRGGIKLSGYGREGGQEGIRRFANTKTVYIN